ncbi:MAG: MOSC domain-containing protein [Elusimicrobia bacterium]|nr:MOSC domain-containing protein [Elusimicrobiota bacterium]
MPVVGEVVELWRYPFKSMLGRRLDEVQVGPNGVWGDRGWSLRYADSRKNVSAKQVASLMLCEARYLEEPTETANPAVEITLPDGKTVPTDGDSAPAILSELAGCEVVLDAAPGAHFDDYPIHLLTTASLQTLSRLNPASNFDARRFRPNIVIKAQGEIQEGFVEFGWCGSDLRVGGVDLLVKKATRRCVMTTHPQQELAKDPEVLKTLAQSANADLGVYCAVLSPGRIKVGDPVVLL